VTKEVSGTDLEDGQTCEGSGWERQLQKTAVRTEQRKLFQWSKFSSLIIWAAVPLPWKVAASVSLSFNKL